MAAKPLAVRAFFRGQAANRKKLAATLREAARQIEAGAKMAESRGADHNWYIQFEQPEEPETSGVTA